jgi:hypothetical protein
VPLEHRTVRFIDNFSARTRGATSAKYFLEAVCHDISTKVIQPLAIFTPLHSCH